MAEEIAWLSAAGVATSEVRETGRRSASPSSASGI